MLAPDEPGSGWRRLTDEEAQEICPFMVDASNLSDEGVKELRRALFAMTAGSVSGFVVASGREPTLAEARDIQKRVANVCKNVILGLIEEAHPRLADDPRLVN